MDKIPVRYVGFQEGFPEGGIKGFELVDEPSGSTKAFDPDKHIIIGISDTAKSKGIILPAYLISYTIRCENCKSNIWFGKQDGLTCICHNYGYTGHEESLFCSDDCLTLAHPDDVPDDRIFTQPEDIIDPFDADQL